MKNLSKIIFGLAFLFIASIFTANAVEIPGLAPLLFVVGVVISFTIYTQPGFVFTALNITDLNTALGSYYRKNKDGIISEMLLGMNVDQNFEVWDDVKDEVPLPSLEISDLVKPANDTTFSPTANALKFGARILKVRKWKVDLLIVPGDLEKTWLGRYKKKGSDPMDLPFEQYIFDYIIQKVHNNVRMSALYNGIYNAGGTAPVDIMNGLKKLIADEITATTITPITTGVVTEANVIASLLAVYDGIGDAYKNVPTQMIVSNQLFDWYTRKYNPISNTSLVVDDINKLSNAHLNQFPLAGTNCVLKREPGMGASQRIICTPKTNMVYGTDSFGEENNIKVQEFERTIKIMIDAKSGVNFKQINANALAVSEQV
jgi:hypothetical protein